MLTTDQKGAIAEATIALAALELGIAVSRPLVERPYDFIFELGSRLHTSPVQMGDQAWRRDHRSLLTITKERGRSLEDLL